MLLYKNFVVQAPSNCEEHRRVRQWSHLVEKIFFLLTPATVGKHSIKLLCYKLLLAGSLLIISYHAALNLLHSQEWLDSLSWDCHRCRSEVGACSPWNAGISHISHRAPTCWEQGVFVLEAPVDTCSPIIQYISLTPFTTYHVTHSLMVSFMTLVLWSPPQDCHMVVANPSAALKTHCYL